MTPVIVLWNVLNAVFCLCIRMKFVSYFTFRIHKIVPFFYYTEVLWATVGATTHSTHNAAIFVWFYFMIPFYCAPLMLAFSLCFLIVDPIPIRIQHFTQ